MDVVAALGRGLHRAFLSHTMRRTGSIFFLTALTLAGCVTRETRTGGTIIPPPPGSTPPAFGSASQTSVSSIGVCTVPYDGFTLPLLSPDGRWLATQIGVPPTWPTLLAMKRQTVPMASSIEIWSLDSRTGRRVTTLAKGLILGRSADNDGFLVEEVLDDGSRRIGRVEWPTLEPEPAAETRTPDARSSLADAPKPLEPEWLIDDGRVNAFAALSVDANGLSTGSIAWCSRDIEGDGFALSVKHGATSAQWDIPPMPEQGWLLPLFSRDGRTLFAMSLRDGVVDLVAGDPSDRVAFEQSEIRRRLSVRMDAQRTYQTLAPQGTDAAVGPGDSTTLVLFDPDLRRMTIWNPTDSTYRPLTEGSFAATIVADGSVMVGDGDGIVLDHPAAAPGFPPRVYPRSAIPRHVQYTGDGPHDWVLLVPDRRSISIVRFALLEASLTGR